MPLRFTQVVKGNIAICESDNALHYAYCPFNSKLIRFSYLKELYSAVLIHSADKQFYLKWSTS